MQKFLSFNFVSALLVVISAHSFFTYPEPYNRCDGEAISSCPVVRPKHRFAVRGGRCMHYFTSVRQPAATWKRGQRVRIKWARNNHYGGFIRLSFVPVNKMFSKNAHDKFAFYFGCWEQGLYKCSGVDHCGTDQRNGAFSRKIKIPKVLPDGNYVLAMVWYGGLDFRRQVGLYADYSSCSYVKIKGGTKKFRYKPFFAAGNTRPFKSFGMCYTSGRWPGQCGKGCHRQPAFFAKPYPFHIGKTPTAIKWSDYKKAMK